MKNKFLKKVFLAIFLMCGFIAALCITASAADVVISNVAVTGVTEPLPGYAPVFRYSQISVGAVGTFDGWYDLTAKQEVTSTTKYVGGHDYMCTLTVTPSSGYKFASNLSGSINGNSCTVSGSGSSRELLLFFHCPSTVIKNVAVTIQTPTVGQKPDYSPKTTTTGVSIYNSGGYCTVWKTDGTGSEYTSSSSYVLQPNRTYTIKTYIVTTSWDYKFASASQLKATINGYTASVSDEGNGLYCISCSFKPEKALIPSVYVKDVTFPAENTKIGTSFSVSTANAYIGSASDAVKWTMNGGYSIGSSTYFSAGNEYRLTLKIMPNDGYAFDFDKLDARLYKSGSGTTYVVPEIKKGVQTQLGVNYDGLTLSYTFPKLDVKITDINLSGITIPAEGAHPDMSTPKIAQNGAVIYGTRWRLSDGSNSKDLNANSVFEAGKNYSYIVYLEPKDGFAFEAASKMTATLNGNSAEISSVSGGENKRAVTYTFYVEPTPVNKVALTVTEPSLGAKPAATASTAGGNYYIASVNWDPSESAFAANKSYSVIITLETTNGSVFAKSMSSATINNKTAKILSGAGTEQLKISYTFPMVKAAEITSVNITGIDAPVTGAVPDLKCNVDSVGVTVESVSWFEPHYIFEAGKAYTVSVYLMANSGYAFADKVNATINGSSADYHTDSYGNHIVSYTFPATEIPKANIPTIIDQPKGGTYKLGDTPKMMFVTVKLNDSDSTQFQWYMTSVNDISTIKAIYDEDDEAYGTQSFFIPEQLEGTTYYCVMITNNVVIDGRIVASESVYSDLVAVTFTKEIGIPSVITSPESVTAKLGEYVKLSTFIKPIGEGELHIQWYKSSEYNMSGAAPISGANGVDLIPDQILGTAYYRAAAYMEYKGMHSETVYTKTAAVTFENDEVTVEGIEILNTPAKLEYIKGETLNTDQMIVRVVMSDGYKNITSGFTCSPTVMNTVGTQKITVTYEGKTAVFNVTVKNSHTHNAGSEWKADGINHWNLCTCGQNMNEAAHTFGEWNVVKEATDTEDETRERVCSVCGYKEIETRKPETDEPITDAPITDAPITDEPTPDDSETVPQTTGENVNPGEGENETGFPWWIIIVIAGAAAAAVVIIIVVKSKKKS
ncbi:MAG: bacterial Ig-like domain-containing protein [Firmicutes bacterium]|nr:bacterial Ig-like domain-containing protein [Bacillota bacterium]